MLFKSKFTINSLFQLEWATSGQRLLLELSPVNQCQVGYCIVLFFYPEGEASREMGKRPFCPSIEVSCGKTNIGGASWKNTNNLQQMKNHFSPYYPNKLSPKVFKIGYHQSDKLLFSTLIFALWYSWRARYGEESPRHIALYCCKEKVEVWMNPWFPSSIF